MSNEICVMCNQDVDNPYELGEKIISGGIAVHYFCVLLSSNLPQNGEDEEGIYGFLPADILKEKRRASKKKCTFCHKNGANISCCDKKCPRSFHLPCAIKQDCRFEFCGAYKSFCHKHHNLKETDRHQETDLCAICHDEMGKFNVIRSIQSPCCKWGWYHKNCLSQYAAAAALFMKCTICNRKIDEIRQAIEERGVFIPQRDAMWEKQNAFYEFEQQLMRPSKCVAKRCGMSNGRDYCYNENNEYLLIVCTNCGSNGVHECCLNDKDDFICNDCGPPSNKRRKLNEANGIDTMYYEPQPKQSLKKRRKIAKPIYETDANNNVEMESSPKTSKSTSKPGFVLWEIRIKLPPLTDD